MSSPLLSRRSPVPPVAELPPGTAALLQSERQKAAASALPAGARACPRPAPTHARTHARARSRSPRLPPLRDAPREGRGVITSGACAVTCPRRPCGGGERSPAALWRCRAEVGRGGSGRRRRVLPLLFPLAAGSPVLPSRSPLRSFPSPGGERGPWPARRRFHWQRAAAGSGAWCHLRARTAAGRPGSGSRDAAPQPTAPSSGA